MDLDDNETVLAAAEFFQDLDETQRRLLAFSSERMTHEAGAVLYRARGMAEGAHVLISGALEITGEGETRRLTEPGAMVAGMALLVARPRPVTVTATKTSQTLFIPRTAFLKLVRSYPDLAERIAKRIHGQLGDYVRALRPVRANILKNTDRE